jgi:alanyl-tRNA synthetase
VDTNTLRRKYLDFFASKGHKIVPSSSLVREDDPTLLFTSAGMNQFKKEFLGQLTDFRAAASCQRCLRTDDLDVVGVTSYHHTFFEMLGNFSFGSYFKEEAIAWAWEFLTETLKLNQDAFWVSVYQEDAQAYDIWKNKVGFPEKKIVKLGPRDNFWPANAILDGPNGPCGPCSEIFFDYGIDTGCKGPDCKPGCPCGRFVEIWNLVFTQFNRKDKGVLEPLPHKNIDTGMGLERMAAVLQGVKSNFEIDIFKPIIKAIFNYELSTTNYQLINAIADHIRAIIFAIYDGVSPSNEQRGYVVRKLIRKAEFHGHSLGIKNPFLYQLAPVAAATFNLAYPDLKNKIAGIANVIQQEEKNFISTLKEAPRILEAEFKGAKPKSHGACAPRCAGHVAFKLRDTYGIPLEITKSWAKERGFEISDEEFYQDLKEQQERSKKSSKLLEGVFVGEAMKLDVKKTKFLGYQKLQVEDAKILMVIKDALPAARASAGEPAQLILDKTPFYGESGGQIGDRGRILKGKNIFIVENTIKQGSVFLHSGKIESGKFKKGDAVSASVDADFRQAVTRAHSATHLLQAALREALGEHIKQAGSLVEADRLRFDFEHCEKIPGETLRGIEDLVQKNILGSYEVKVREATLEQAKKSRALAFFGDKYESKVRVVHIGDFSKELCGGTHLRNSSEAGLFKIISESSIAKGVRRIEALTGALAWEALRRSQSRLDEISDLIKTADDKIIPLLEDKFSRLDTLEKELSRLRLEIFKYDANALIDKAQNVNNTKIICNKYNDLGIDMLRQIADTLKSRLSSYAFCLASASGTRACLVAGLSDDIVAKGLDAAKIIKEVAVLIDGSGGGRQVMAQAGGSNIKQLDKALEKFREIIRRDIGQ